MKEDLMNLLRNFNQENPEAYFDQVSRLLLNNFVFKFSDGKNYRLTEIEFYCFYINGKNDHPDPYTYYEFSAEKKISPYFPKNCGCWYVHPSGVDITFGKDGNVCGGVLLRAATLADNVENKIDKDKDIPGPLLLRNSLFGDTTYASLKEQFNSSNGISIIEYIEKETIDTPIYKSSRFGLIHKDTDHNDFDKRPYRHLTFMKKTHKGKESIAKYLLCNEDIKPCKLNDVFGYTIVNITN